MKQGEKFAIIKALGFLKFECQCKDSTEYAMSPLINAALRELCMDVFPNFNFILDENSSEYKQQIPHVKAYIIKNFNNWLTLSMDYKREIFQMLLGSFEISDLLLIQVIESLDNEFHRKD